MKNISSTGFGRVVVVSCQRGDNIYDAITKSLNNYGIKNAVVLSGVATFEQLNYHYVKDCNPLPSEKHLTLNGPFEISSMDGLVVDGIPHIHITASDQETVVSAHLEPDSKVLYVAEIVLAELLGLEGLKRTKTPEGIRMLSI